jgi:hypothetical protein
MNPVTNSYCPEKKSHNERCCECKISVRNMLAALFGCVEVNWDLNLPCRLEDYRNTSLASILGEIHEALENLRGFKHFVRSYNLPRVDYFIPGKNLIIEFDESQHFTKPREVALSLYPRKHGWGFSLKRWGELCRSLDKRDDNPPYRDEQRAWYDTLRDFAPRIRGSGQTLRLYSRDQKWCSMNPHSESDLNDFRQILLNRSERKCCPKE